MGGGEGGGVGWDWGTSVLIGPLFKQSAFFCSNPAFLLEVNDIKFISIIVHELEPIKIGIWLRGVEKT